MSRDKNISQLTALAGTDLASADAFVVYDQSAGSNAWTKQISASELATALGRLGGSVYNVKDAAYGAVGDGSHDDTVAVQAAITACQNSAGRGIVFFPAGSYKITSSLLVAANGVCFEGVGGGRYSQNGGSQLLYYGTGACIQIGTSKIGGAPLYDASYSSATYDGYQWTRVRKLSLHHGNTDTPLLNGQQNYKAGSIGVQDWRGGNIVMEDVWIENFDYPIWLLQSDFNAFHDLTCIYCHSGIYMGPRSDQNTFYNLQVSLSDTALWLDTVSAPRFIGPSFVGCGSATTPAVKIKTQYSAGSTSVVFSDVPWFERLQGYVGTVTSFIEIGKGGSTPEGPIMIYDPLIRMQAVSTITSYFAEIDQATEVFILRASNAASGFNLFVKYILFSGTGSPFVHFTTVPDRTSTSASTSSGTPVLVSHENTPQVCSQRNASLTVPLDLFGILPITCAGGNVVATLPAASAAPNRTLTVKRTDGSANTCTVTCAGADTYDDATASKTIAANGVLRLIANANGNGWLVI